MDPLELLAALDDDPASVTTDALLSARDEIRELIDAATDPDDPDVELAEQLAPALAKVDTELAARDQAAAAARERAASIREAAGITDPPDDTDDTDDPDDPDPADDPAEPVPAGTTAAGIIDRLRATIAARPAPAPAVVREPDVTVRAVGPAAGTDLTLATLGDVAKTFAAYAPHVGRRQRSALVRLDFNYPTGRRLGDDTDTNTRRLDAVTAPRAVTAAGGLCAPLEADFSNPICGDRGRPIRDALPTFNATRGGIRYSPSATIADVEGGITLWTAANDANPTDPATKACPPVDCPPEVECTVDAVVACLTVGNFQARFNPEFWASRLDLLMVAHDRTAELTAAGTIDANSTQVTYAGGAGTVTDVLVAIDKAAAGIRSRNRLIGTTLRLIAPAWLRDALRAQLATNTSCGSGTDAYAAADATITSFFTSRNINVTWSPDLDPFADQAEGALAEWPGGDVELFLFPEGTFVFLDGGTLDLGTEISDSALNATNDRQAFMETFEQVCFRGCESLSITVPVTEVCGCPVETAPAG